MTPSRRNISDSIQEAIHDRRLAISQLANELATRFLQAPAQFDPSCLDRLGPEGIRMFLSLIGAAEVASTGTTSMAPEPPQTANSVGWTRQPKLPLPPAVFAVAAGSGLGFAIITAFGLAIAIL